MWIGELFSAERESTLTSYCVFFSNYIESATSALLNGDNTTLHQLADFKVNVLGQIQELNQAFDNVLDANTSDREGSMARDTLPRQKEPHAVLEMSGIKTVIELVPILDEGDGGSLGDIPSRSVRVLS